MIRSLGKVLSLFTVENWQIKSQFIIIEYVRFCMSRKFSSDDILICKKSLLGQLMLPSAADCVVVGMLCMYGLGVGFISQAAYGSRLCCYACFLLN